MSKFLPNLPIDDVKAVVMSVEYESISKAIGEAGIKIIPTKPIEKVCKVRYNLQYQQTEYTQLVHLVRKMTYKK